MSGEWTWEQVVLPFIIPLIGSTETIIQDVIAEDQHTHGSTLIPIILESDKTTMSVATGNNEYYSLYMSIGNVQNNVQHAHHDALVVIIFLAIPKSKYQVQ